MTDTAFQIKNPSVTLYAFHLSQDLTQAPGQLGQDADLLWQNCAKLSEPLAIPDIKSLPEKLQSHPTQIATISYIELLPDNGRLKYTPPLQIEGSALTVEVYPIQIHDAYALDLTLYYPNITVSVGQFSHLNPQGCLLANKIGASLGQTLLIYAEPVGSSEEDKNLADACVHAFLQATNQQKPALVEVGKLFGSPIFEYDNGQEKPSEQCHILVWLNRHPETLNLAQKTYFSFLNLLCCRSKILFAYHQARWCYYQTRELYAKLEKNAEHIQQLSDRPEQRLKQLKEKLSQIPAKIFKYSRYLRDIGDHKTAIITNVKNYEYWLGKISDNSLQADRLDFLENFLNQTSKRYQDQINLDLNYLAPGQQLFEQMQVAIRGIVEIEQAESDRKREQQQKKLERVVALVGTGLAVSGLSAQSPGKPVETILTQLYPKQSLNCPKDGLAPCLRYNGLYVVFNLGVGVIAALILGLILHLVSKQQRKRSDARRA